MTKRLVLLTALLLFASGSPALAGFYGPMVSVLERGQFSGGLGYFYSNLTLEGDSLEMQQHHAYAQLGLGLGGKWEIYLRGGGASLLLDNVLGDEEATDSLRPFGTVGLKGPLFDGQVLDVALFVQGSYYSEYEDRVTDGVDIIDITLSDTLAVSGGIALEVTIEGAQLYTAPFFYQVEGDGEVVSANPLLAGKGTFRADGNLGGVVGINWPLISGWHLNLEGQIMDGYLAGMALTYPF